VTALWNVLRVQQRVISVRSPKRCDVRCQHPSPQLLRYRCACA